MARTPSVTALRRWLVFVALLRLLSGASWSSWQGTKRGNANSRERDQIKKGETTIAHLLFSFGLELPPQRKTVYLGFFLPQKLQSNLFDRAPHLVNDLTGRLFAVWTLTTCALCLVCARDPRVRPVYAATLFSFGAAAAFFASEALVFGTVSLRSAANPGTIAGISLVWMGMGWSYYTRHASAIGLGGGNGTGGAGGAGGSGGSGGIRGGGGVGRQFPEASEDLETESVSKID
jgi:hypothetical protein